ncbi:MAG TPA: FAD-dependent oxidoreductase [Terricaulis sp.]|nr:FAD-dependent oxidoreductase [Terricaulis sp.]
MIVGAGVTGAFLAERMSRAGWSVAVFDKRTPQCGATAASTALVMWETDCPLIALEQRLGFEAAATVWRRCFCAIQSMLGLAAFIGVEAERRDSLYLCGDMLDASLLKEEGALRLRAGLPSTFQHGDAIWSREGVVADAGLRSRGAAAIDPIQFSRALLETAQSRGAYVYDGEAVEAIFPGETQVRANTSGGVAITARALVLATGYEMPAFVHTKGHRIDSTWVVALACERANLSPSPPLVWEASSVYAYMRQAGSHIVIGGEDERGLNAQQRNARMPEKSRALMSKLRGLCPFVGSAAPDLAWSAFFGATEDGLPLIGPVPGAPRTFAAYGYGGNGITFSALAGTLLFHRLAGSPDGLEKMFALDRF